MRDFDQFASACAALTDAHSNTAADTSPRHGSPRTSFPASSSYDTGASGARPSFQAFISLMTETFDQDRAGVRSAAATPYDRSAARWSRLAFTRPK